MDANYSSSIGVNHWFKAAWLHQFTPRNWAPQGIIIIQGSMMNQHLVSNTQEQVTSGGTLCMDQRTELALVTFLFLLMAFYRLEFKYQHDSHKCTVYKRADLKWVKFYKKFYLFVSLKWDLFSPKWLIIQV